MITNFFENSKRLSTKGQHFWSGFKNFCFPIRFHGGASGSIRLLILIGMTIALRLILHLFSIKIGPMVFSIAVLPMAILGWHIGPVLGFFVGFLSNTLSWMMSGAVWFWMYSIQEPMYMVVSSLFAKIYEWRVKSNKVGGDFIFFQILLIVFSCLIAWIIFSFHENGENSFTFALKIVTMTVLVVFFVAINCFLIHFIRYNKIQKYDFKLLIYIASFTIFSSFLFSFILGTISAIEYVKYISGGSLPFSRGSNYYQFYFLPFLGQRIFKETFRDPLLIFLFFFIQKIYLPEFEKLKYKTSIYW